MEETKTESRGHPRQRPLPVARVGAGQNTKIQTMKHNNSVIRCGSLVAAIGVAWALSMGTAQAGDTKPYKGTLMDESLVTYLNPGALPQPFFVQARADHGPELGSYVVHLYTQSNVGGKGTGFGFENVHVYPAGPKGIILYLMGHETTANGDKLAWAGTIIPQSDGSSVSHLEFLPAQSTGRFAGATGVIDSVRPVPGGAELEGTITTVSATK